MPISNLNRTISFLNSALKSCAESRNSRSAALHLFRQLLQFDVKPNDLTFSLLLKAFTLRFDDSISAKLESAQIHSCLVKCGIHQFLYVGTSLLDLYLRLGCKSDARKLFDEMPNRDAVSWNALISGLSRRGDGYDALQLFVQFLRDGFMPLATTLAVLFPCCGRSELFLQGRSVHCFGIKVGLDLDSHVGNALTSMYGKLGELDKVELLFETMHEKSIVSWNTMISSYGQNGLFNEAMFVFKQMIDEHVEISFVTLVSLLSADVHLESVHCYAIKSGFEADGSVVTSLVCGYAMHGDTMSAETLYRCQPQTNLVSLTAIISGYAEKGDMNSVMKHFAQMQSIDMKLDAVALVGILHGLANHSTHIDVGISFHCYGLKTGLCLDCLVINGLITMYSKFNNLKAVFSLFSEMKEKPLPTWNSVISGFVQAGEASEAIKLFCQLMLFGHKPDTTTIASVLCGCSRLGYLHLGQKLHSYVLRNSLDLEGFVETALIDMYTKCGRIDHAERVFRGIKDPCLATWNSMISCYSWFGYERRALAYYSELQQQGLKPDRITFLGVLAACFHGGLVDEGREIFHIMTKIFCMVPTLQHYACMVGLLGRAGLFEEAIKFINNMCIEPDTAVWGALLSACCIHREVKLGESLAKKLFLLDQKNGGFYVLMSNLYAVEGRWDDVARVRQVMKDIGGDGCYGASQIEVYPHESFEIMFLLFKPDK